MNSLKIAVMILLYFLISGCSNPDSSAMPEHLGELENLAIYPADVEPAYEITLKRQVVFGDTEEVFLGPSIRHVTTDVKGRLYIADIHEKVIHVYARDGSHLDRIGRDGQGPGEFQRIAALRIINDHIKVLDPVQSKISIFDVDTFEHQEDIHIAIPEGGGNIPSWIEWTHENQLFYRAIDFYINTDGNYLIIFGDQSVGAFDNLEGRTWEVSIFDPVEEKYLRHDVQSFKADMNAFTFDGGRISSVLFKPEAYLDANRERMVYAWGGELLFNFYDTKGDFQHAFYHNRPNTELELDELLEFYNDELANFEELRGQVLRSLRISELPQRWPAFHALKMDDENRVWISTIVEDFDIYEWWVLEDSGEVIAKFDWPRDKPIREVKNGYAYTLETEEETGLQTVVRYTIEMD